jgi:hypothetical protein
VIFQLFENLIAGASHLSGRVQIFDTHQPLTMALASIQKAGQGTDQ